MERHQSVLSSPPVIVSTVGTFHSLHSICSSPRVRSKSRTGTQDLDAGGEDA